MEEKTFGKVLEGFTMDERDAIIFDISQRSNVDMVTVRRWATGERHPRRRSREKTVDVLREKGLLPQGCELIFKQ
jgi:hypothetical protein